MRVWRAWDAERSLLLRGAYGQAWRWRKHRSGRGSRRCPRRPNCLLKLFLSLTHIAVHRPNPVHHLIAARHPSRPTHNHRRQPRGDRHPYLPIRASCPLHSQKMVRLTLSGNPHWLADPSLLAQHANHRSSRAHHSRSVRAVRHSQALPNLPSLLSHTSPFRSSGKTLLRPTSAGRTRSTRPLPPTLPDRPPRSPSRSSSERARHREISQKPPTRPSLTGTRRWWLPRPARPLRPAVPHRLCWASVLACIGGARRTRSKSQTVRSLTSPRYPRRTTMSLLSRGLDLDSPTRRKSSTSPNSPKAPRHRRVSSGGTGRRRARGRAIHPL